jgi:hypothetical protein
MAGDRQGPAVVAWALWALAIVGLVVTVWLDQLLRRGGRPELVVLLLTPTGALPSPRWRWWAGVTAATPVALLLVVTPALPGTVTASPRLGQRGPRRWLPAHVGAPPA